MTAEKGTGSKTWGMVMIAVAVIGCIGVVLAALITGLPEWGKFLSDLHLPSRYSRDVAAQTMGYADLDAFMQAFGIPAELKSRIQVCPREETYCLTLVEQLGKPDFHFKNVTGCDQDGKWSGSETTIPADFDGMVRGFTVRPCKDAGFSTSTEKGLQ
jgi:hypothetical protein